MESGRHDDRVGARLGRDDLVITGGTLGSPPFRELVAIAADAGFAGLSLWPEPAYGRARAEGLSDHELRAILDDFGMVVHDVDAVCAWVGPGDPGGPHSPETPASLVYQAAEALGAKFVNTVLVGLPGTSLDTCTEVFARLCDEGRNHGLSVTIEFLTPGVVTKAPGAVGVVTSLNDAVRMVRDAGCTNASVLVDTWHFHWTPSTFEDLAETDGSLIGGIQLSDAPTEEPADMTFARRHNRLAPGDGAIDLRRFLRTIRAAGSQAPVTLEVFNDDLLRQLGPLPFARRLHDDVVTLSQEASAS